MLFFGVGPRQKGARAARPRDARIRMASNNESATSTVGERMRTRPKSHHLDAAQVQREMPLSGLPVLSPTDDAHNTHLNQSFGHADCLHAQTRTRDCAICSFISVIGLEKESVCEAAAAAAAASVEALLAAL